MILPDFLNFEPFNHLRKRMGAEDLGDFVFFDPKLHLTGLERLSLEHEGLMPPVAHLNVLSDFTLVYKDSRVLLCQPYEAKTTDEQRLYHVADCPTFYRLQDDERREPNTAGNSSPWSVRCNNPDQQSGSFRVCGACLQRLRYQHFDAARNRHREYSERVQQEFDLECFFQQYPSYPLNDLTQTPIF
mgnify:CR=1 FL=1